MGLCAEALLDYPVPERRHRYTERDTALYALSVGVGQEALSQEQLRFVDYRRDMAVLPSFALVMGYPGFWLGKESVRKATGVDSRRVLHAEQEFEILDRLPASTEVVGTTRITGLVDRGPGKAALLQSERLIADGLTGRPIARCRQVHHLAGQGGFSLSTVPPPEPRRLPDAQPDLVVEMPTRPEQALLYRFNGDENPLHFDPSAAADAGFPRPILHGMCTIGVVTHALVRCACGYEPERLMSQSVRLRGPVFPGETLEIHIWRDGVFRARVAARGVSVAEGHFELRPAGA